MDMNLCKMVAGQIFLFTGLHKYGVSLHVRGIWKNLYEIKEKT